jgi:hypothetical protein
VIVVDNLMIPSAEKLEVEQGQYARYRVKEWKGDGQIDLLKDKLIVYATVDGKERFYSMDRTGYLEMALKTIPPGAEIELRFSKGFPKVWQRSLQEIRLNGLPVVRYTNTYIEEKQAFIYTFSGIMMGIFILVWAIGFVGKPRSKKTTGSAKLNI